ncbi:MAG: IclR family transcriptional regulator [Ruegeria sp.]|uniref:IclR family transcriptional regulator n=1 Tax=Ruegeria sp. TaxID=1879320 RepID=UPI00349E9E5F
MGRSSESSIVTKCALVMDVLTHSRQPLAFSEIVAQTGFVKSSCHRILAVLQSEGMVDYEKESRRYRTGPRFFEWARAAWHRTDLQQAAADPMIRLSDETGMNVVLSVLDGSTVLYLRTSDYVSIRFAARAGDHAPLYCTAAGKVFLAHMSRAQRDAVLSSVRFEKFTEFTKTSQEELEEQFPEILEGGYAAAIEEEISGVVGIASPIWNEQNKVAACLSVWALAERAGKDKVLAMVPRLQDATRHISTLIGGAVPSESGLTM